MKLSLLYEEQNLAQLGNLIAHITSKDKIAKYQGESSDFARFMRWVLRPDPRTWDSAISKNVARFAKQLHQSGDTEAQQDAMKWSQLSTMPGLTVISAMAAAPDGASRDSAISKIDMQDGISTPIRDQIGDQAFGILAGVLSKNQTLRDRVFAAIHGSLGTLTPR